jgi:hypothetical protein
VVATGAGSAVLQKLQKEPDAACRESRRERHAAIPVVLAGIASLIHAVSPFKKNTMQAKQLPADSAVCVPAAQLGRTNSADLLVRVQNAVPLCAASGALSPAVTRQPFLTVLLLPMLA